MRPEKIYLKPEAVDNMAVVYEILKYASEHHGNKMAYRQIEGRNNESSITFSELARNVDALRASMLSRGLLGKHIAIFGETSIEWITAYLAIISGVGICVPIDKELSPDTITKQLDFADVELAFCSAKCLKKFQKALPDCPDVNTVAIMRSDTPESVDGCDKVTSMQELIEEGKRLLLESGESAPSVAINPDETCLVIYTSGTTGANKGVMLCNRNIMGTLRGCARLLHYPSTSFSVLPVNHSYELHAHLMSCMYCGTTVCLNDDLKHLLKNLEHFKPEMSCMVPMMLDLIVRKLKKEIEDSGKTQKFQRMVRVSNTMRKVGIDRRRKFFKDILQPLGGELKMVICGGAALSQDTIDFLGNIGIQVYNGYGITECSPVAAVNPISKIRKNSVGHVLPTTKVRIANPDENGNGEIQFQGDNVMKGYYKAPEDTAKVFTEDGWFRTGDLGHCDKDNYIYLSGRLKNLIILPNGKNISPEEVEDTLEKHIPYIKECVVMENSEQTGLYAVIYPDKDFCKANDLKTPQEIKDFMQEDIRNFNRDVPSFKRLSDFEITEKEFEKSTTQKIQRFKIKAKLKEATSNV